MEFLKFDANLDSIQASMQVGKEGPSPPNIGYSWQCRASEQEGKKGLSPPNFGYSWQCPGTFSPSAAHLSASMSLCSSRRNARGELRALEGRRVSSKSPPRLRKGNEWFAERNTKEKCVSQEVLLIFALRANQWFFTYLGPLIFDWIFDCSNICSEVFQQPIKRH